MSKFQQPTAQGLTFRLNLARPSVALSGSILLGLSVWLIASPALAESPYHVARKIGFHSRTSIQQATPAVPQLDPGNASVNTGESPVTSSDAAPVTAKISKSASPLAASGRPSAASGTQKVYPPEPSASETLDNYVKSIEAVATPVPERVASPLETEPASVEQVNQQANQSPAPSFKEAQSLPATTSTDQALGETVEKQAKPAKTESKPARNSHEKKAHPVVIAPEPLLPATDGAQATSGQANPGDWDIKNPTPNKSLSTEKTLTTEASKTSVATPASAQTSKSIASEKRVKASPVRPRTASSWNNRHTSTEAATSSKIHTWEPGFYPVGYTPAVRPVTPDKMQALGTALGHYNRGVYYIQRQEWDKAIDEYKQVLSQNMNMADAYVGLSTAAIYRHDWENALKNSTRALRIKNGFLDPSNITQARYNLSSVYCVSDDYKKSLRYYKLVQKDNHPQSDALWSFIQNTCQPSNTKKSF